MAVINNLLLLILITPMIGIFIMTLISSKEKKILKIASLITACFTFLLSLLLWVFFNKSTGMFQYVNCIEWMPLLNLNLVLGIDGISLFFLLLTTFLVLICLIASWNNIVNEQKEFLISFLVIEIFLIGSFCSLDLLFFYIFFESIILPMFLIIGIWGSRERKIKASYYFFFFTLTGSVLMLLSVIYIYYQVGTTDYEILLTFTFSIEEQRFLWLSFFVSFATKVPIIPLHIWLPEAHVEAPTVGSVILAGVLLKLGVYGFLRFILPLFTDACFYFSPLIYTLCIIGIVYSSLTAIRQIDLKRVIAYISVSHMNLIIIGIFSFSTLGIEGAILQSLSHAFVSSSLFLLIGTLYDRYNTRIIKYYGGLVHTMPKFVLFFFFLSVSNMALPGTSSFIGELLIFLGSYKNNTSVTILSATSIVFSGCYSLWLFNKISFGNLKTKHIFRYIDLNKKELITIFPLTLIIIFLGIFPSTMLDSIHMSVNKLIECMCC